MSGKIPRAFIDDLLVRVDIVDLIDTHVPLKKTGSNFVARCPFHTEKTPSFSVNRNKQLFHCFGCGASGNAIGFLMDFNHLDFVEAVEDLASFAGVPVPRESIIPEKDVNKQNIADVYFVLQQVAVFYAEQLRFSPQAKQAVDYLKTRGVSADFVKEFMLGYASDEWQTLESRFEKQALLDAGLLVLNDEGRSYNRFRGRLMFPIRDKRERVVGFGARVLDESLPKYLNSPETAVFQKGREAYGLFELLKKNARPPRILIVEGYMDVIALAQAGIHYAVATLGTATSKAHLDLLFRYTAELVLCFDGDAAGRQAAWRAMDVVFAGLKEGRQVRVMLLPQGDDPDSLVKKEGGESFAGRISSAQTLSEYFFEYLSATVNLNGIEGRAQLMGVAQPYLSKLPEGFFKQMMFEKLKELAGMNINYENRKIAAADLPVNAPRKQLQAQDRLRITPNRMVIALLLQNPRLIEFIEARDIQWSDLVFPGVELLKKIVDTILRKHPANSAVLLEMFRDTPEYKHVTALTHLDLMVLDKDVDAVFCGTMDRLFEQSYEQKMERLVQRFYEVGLDGLSEQEREAVKKMK